MARMKSPGAGPQAGHYELGSEPAPKGCPPGPRLPSITSGIAASQRSSEGFRRGLIECPPPKWRKFCLTGCSARKVRAGHVQKANPATDAPQISATRPPRSRLGARLELQGCHIGFELKPCIRVRDLR